MLSQNYWWFCPVSSAVGRARGRKYSSTLEADSCHRIYTLLTTGLRIRAGTAGEGVIATLKANTSPAPARSWPLARHWGGSERVRKRVEERERGGRREEHHYRERDGGVRAKGAVSPGSGPLPVREPADIRRRVRRVRGRQQRQSLLQHLRRLRLW